MWSAAAPHFFFNALTTIQAYVRERPALAAELLTNLAEFARTVLAHRAGSTLVAEELALVHLYLGLERIRLGRRLRTIFDIDPATLGLRIPTLLIQPLVENAVVHAVARRTQGATVRVSLRYRPERALLLLCVADDGPGMGGPGDASEGGRLPGSGERLHLGLESLRMRVTQACGDAARLRLWSPPSGGTVAALALPLAPRSRRVLLRGPHVSRR